MVVLSQMQPAFVAKHFKDFPSISLDQQRGNNTQSDLKLFINEQKAKTVTNNSSQEKAMSEETKTAIVEALDKGEDRGLLWTRLVSHIMPLMRKTCQQLWWTYLKNFVFREADGHSELANAYIVYLETSKTFKKAVRVRLQVNTKLHSSEEKYFSKHPFLEYAIVHWMHHAKYGSVDKTDFASPFFRDKDPTRRRKLWWQSYLTSMKRLFAWKIFAPTDLNLLHLAAFFDVVPLAQYLESCKDFKKLQHGEDSYGMRPIDRATERTQVAMVKFLLERGDFAEKTLLQAAQAGEVPIMRLLLDNRRKSRSSQAESPMKDYHNPFNLKTLRKRTLNSVSDLSNKLFDADHCSPTSPESPMSPASPVSPASPLTPSSPFVKSNVSSETPLHVATKCGHLEVVHFLLEYGEDVNQTTASKWTALHYAAYFCRRSIAEHLISAGARGGERTSEQATILHCAVLSEQFDIATLFLQHQVVEIDAQDIFGQTAFRMACKSDNTQLMELLLNCGANIEQTNKIGWTPLMLACQGGRVKALKFLLKHNANVNATWAGLGPLEITKKSKPPNATNYDEIVQILEKVGVLQREESEVDEAQVKLLAYAEFGSYDLPQVNDAGPDLEAVSAPIEELDLEDVDSSDESDAESNAGSDSDKERKSGLEYWTRMNLLEAHNTEGTTQGSGNGPSSTAAGSTALSGLRESLTNAYRSAPDATSKAGRSIAKAATSSWGKIRGTKDHESSKEAASQEDLNNEQPPISQDVADTSLSQEVSNSSNNCGVDTAQPASVPPKSTSTIIRRLSLFETSSTSPGSPTDTASEVSAAMAGGDEQQAAQDAGRRRSESSLNANALLGKMSFGRKRFLPLSAPAPIVEEHDDETSNGKLDQTAKDESQESDDIVARVDAAGAPSGSDVATPAASNRFGKLAFGRKQIAK
ncbi:hypothetical protein BST61_g1487 [Cercospora zeina]